MNGMPTTSMLPPGISSHTNSNNNNNNNNNNNPSTHHQRTKSSVLRSLMGHRRNNSDGNGLPAAVLTPTTSVHVNYGGDYQCRPQLQPLQTQYPQALGELRQNRQERSPERRAQPASPQKSGFATISLKAFAVKGNGGEPSPTKPPKSSSSKMGSGVGSGDGGGSGGSPKKPKKAKSSTNLAALLSRPKSLKNLRSLVSEDDAAAAAQAAKDKENRTPPSSLGSDHTGGMPPPIYAQFASQHSTAQLPSGGDPFYGGRKGAELSSATELSAAADEGFVTKLRPKSFQPYVTRQDEARNRSKSPSKHDGTAGQEERRGQTWREGGKAIRPSVRHAFAGLGGGGKTKSTTSLAASDGPVIDPKDIDTHLEAMLDRRNIPENQRYKMRNLNNIIKMEFVRQDWAETQQQQQQQAKPERPGTNDSEASTDSRGSAAAGGSSDQDENNGNNNSKKQKKHTRGRSLTLVRGAANKDKAASNSPTKKQRTENSLGRHFKTKSSDSVVSSDHGGGGGASSSGETNPSGGGFGSGILAKVKGQQGPGDFVQYLRKVQQPELVEVGKLHKLRLLLRNETVTWTEEFIRQGGMKEIVELLHRIMAVEWREEHEDALLHENLLCLKALCTTALALQYLHSIQATLFPALLHMIFDPERKGPSEFTTRNIITSVLLTYIESATGQERMSRAQTVLRYLRDPEAKEEERPVSFVLDMHRERPYRVWCKEVVSVTKEVFWIFLHNLNIVALPPAADKLSPSPSSAQNQIPALNTGIAPSTANSAGSRPASYCPDHLDGPLSYMGRHFPQERPPVPAAPYVGGVEWDATNYLASHLDLMNAIMACTGPTASERNALRAELRISGFERCLGGSLRLCKEKFYGAVHDGLRTWVAAAAEDGWDVRDVRYGPPPESRSASPAKRAGGKKKTEEVPKLEMPKLDFALDHGSNNLGCGATNGNLSNDTEGWLS
ncbi:armadillo-type protein [Podospora didyma]|uniref:Armadillo-type protein n=1 Tax=Podospora didyma TaxID=330526 RepID=A0AAE0TW03_9PEZI|nr:armadillo-type protein [Podospora didyma]